MYLYLLHENLGHNCIVLYRKGVYLVDFEYTVLRAMLVDWLYLARTCTVQGVCFGLGRILQ